MAHNVCTTSRRCTATTKRGDPCPNSAVWGSEPALCASHLYRRKGLEVTYHHIDGTPTALEALRRDRPSWAWARRRPVCRCETYLGAWGNPMPHYLGQRGCKYHQSQEGGTMAVRKNEHGYPLIQSAEDLRRVTAADLEDPKVWAAVSSLLESMGRGAEGVRSDEPPQSLADVRGRPAEYVNKHWPAIVKLLEEQGQRDAEERRAKHEGEATR